jgi:hypothetical protein
MRGPIVAKLVHRHGLHDAAVLHDGETFAHVTHDREIVADENVRK